MSNTPPNTCQDNKDKLFVLSQHLLPHHLLSRLIGGLAECQVGWLKNALIKAFIRQYGVDMSEALAEDPSAYANFNAFFGRQLKADARPIAPEQGTLISPVDGMVSQLGAIENGRIFQAKGHSFSVLELLGGDQAQANLFQGGDFATLYLSPKDYHRVHMPASAALKEMTYIPGRLFSVNQVTTQQVPRLFARNERVVCLFDSAWGPFALVLVGAMIVASIETAWAGLVTPPKRVLRRTPYGGRDGQAIFLPKGEEMGRFLLGSTVILLFGPDQVRWAPELVEQAKVRMGQPMASWQNGQD